MLQTIKYENDVVLFVYLKRSFQFSSSKILFKTSLSFVSKEYIVNFSLILDCQFCFNEIFIQLFFDTSMKLLFFQSTENSLISIAYAFLIFLSSYVMNSFKSLVFISICCVFEIIEEMSDSKLKNIVVFVVFLLIQLLFIEILIDKSASTI